MARLRGVYKNELALKLKEELGLENVMQVPRITKITLNMGVGGAAQDKKMLDGAVADMQLISGQKPAITLARKSIAGFKIREGWPIGCKVTLRGDRMYEFLDRLISITIPRILTSVVLVQKLLMAVVITAWVSKNKSYSLKLTLIKSVKFAV